MPDTTGQISGLIENFIRRVEKILPDRATIPQVGTNHVDDLWLETDIYPGELSINLKNGSLYTTDGVAIVDINRENMILSGLVVSKDTSGLNKLTVSSGHARINGIHYYHASATGSGTDVYLPFNYGTCNSLYFIYIESSTAIADGQIGASGNLKGVIGYTSMSGLMTEPGLFSDIAYASDVPSLPEDSVLLGTVLMYNGGTGYELWPRSVSNVGDYYPKFSVTPSEFLRNSIYDCSHYSAHSLYFPGEFVIDDLTNTAYLSKQIFVSDYLTIATDISNGNLVPVIGSSGSGASGSMSVSNLGSGATVYAQTVGSNIQLRSIIGATPVNVSYGANEITVSIDSSQFLFGITNIGSGIQVLSSVDSGIAKLRSITAGSNISITTSGDNVLINVPEIGTTAQGINLGSELNLYAGMSGKDLTFKSISLTGGLTGSINSSTLTISGEGVVKGGENTGGPFTVYAGITNQNMQFYGLSAGQNITLALSGDTIVISASGSSASSTQGVNLGTGASVYAGMSGSNLSFNNILSGAGIAIGTSGNDIIITSNILNGSQGPQGISGSNGSNGSQGPQGVQGAIGLSSTVIGPQGFQGFQGYGTTGSQGPMGPQGTPSDMKFVDIYDNVGGQLISVGSFAPVAFGTTRINTAPSVFTIATGGTSVTINEDGYYQFIYNTTFTLKTGDFAKFYLYEAVKGHIEGSDVILAPRGSTALTTVTGKVGMTCSVGDTFSVVGELPYPGDGPMTSWEKASSFMVSKLEVGIGPQGVYGVQGPQGIPGPSGDSIINYTLLPITGNGSSATPIQLSYSTDFTLNDLNEFYLNLDYIKLVTPTIDRSWNIYMNDASTPFPSTVISGLTVSSGSTESSIIVPTGCVVSYGGTATIPAAGAGEGFPTAITGDWTIGLTGPTTSFYNALGVTSSQAYNITLTKPSQGGLGITGSINDMSTWRITRISGTDITTASDSVIFSDIFYWGTCGSLGAGEISESYANTLSASDVQNLTNYNFGTKVQTLDNVIDSYGQRIVLAYPASHGDLININMDEGTSILGAFWKIADKTIGTISGGLTTYRVYVAISDDSYKGNKLSTK